MKKTVFIVINLSLLGCASRQIATSDKKEVLSHQEEVITKIPNKPSLSGFTRSYKQLRPKVVLLTSNKNV